MANTGIVIIVRLHRLCKPHRQRERKDWISPDCFCTISNLQMRRTPHLSTLILCGSCSPPLHCTLWLPCINDHQQKWNEVKCLQHIWQRHKGATVMKVWNNMWLHSMLQWCKMWPYASWNWRRITWIWSVMTSQRHSFFVCIQEVPWGPIRCH